VFRPRYLHRSSPSSFEHMPVNKIHNDDNDSADVDDQPDVASAAAAEFTDVCLSNSAPSTPAFSATTVCSRSLSAFSDAISL